MNRQPFAYAVINGEGTHRSLFFDRARAEQWAARCSGTVHPLYLWPEPDKCA